MANQCAFCNSINGVKQYAVTIDGEELRMAPWLCQDHGERFVIRHGMLLGSLDRPIDEVFVAK